MEKLAYQLWKKDDDSLETFKKLLLTNLSKDIGELVSELQINIADADVLPANNLVQLNQIFSQSTLIKLSDNFFS